MLRPNEVNRRTSMIASAAGLAQLALRSTTHGQEKPTQNSTRFQTACMTLPYSQYPLARALSGIKSAGFEYVALYTSHKEAGETKAVPVMPPDGPLSRAKEIGQRCRDGGLKPLLMFSGIYPEDPKGVEVLRQRIQQAEAAGVGQVLTFGHTSGNNRKVWVERFKELG